MKLKDPSKVELKFFLEDPATKQVVRIPSKGGAKDLSELTRGVLAQVAEFDKFTGGSYTRLAKEEAKDLGLDWFVFWSKVVQHQMCLRSQDQVRDCYNDGYGDKLHSIAAGIDEKLEKSSSKIVKKVGASIIQGATYIATGKSSRKLSGCSTCGGTRVFSPSEKSLGRAGKVNQLTNQ